MTHPDPEFERLSRLLKAAMPPVQSSDPPSDLWPRMLRRIEEPPGPAAEFGWREWLLAAAIVLLCAIFPESIALVFYHL